MIDVRYPNLVAEKEASGYHISTLADHANITSALMYEILFGGADLELSEAQALYHLFAASAGDNGYCADYLFAPQLATLNPRKPKNRYRAVLLCRGIQALENYPLTDLLHIRILRQAKAALSAMQSGQRIKYALYRNAISDLELIRQIFSKPARCKH